MKKSKRFVLGMLVTVLAFGLSVAGCATPSPNYYNFGNVSEENCAQIVVFPVTRTGNFNVQTTLESIDGQADWYKWTHKRVPIVGDGKAIVRVEPGSHTFTAKFGLIPANPTSPISITYDCVADRGYRFEIAEEGTSAKIVLYEAVIDGNREFGEFKVVAEYKN
jgi:hypothetical protein